MKNKRNGIRYPQCPTEVYIGNEFRECGKRLLFYEDLDALADEEDN